jgi:hypothetical protein
VNYLRHEGTSYHRHLNEIAGRTGVRIAYHELRDKCDEAIIDAYPDLAAECVRQALRAIDRE